MKKTPMNRETQKWLREIVRKEFPELVKDATFYYQAGGIKFWGVTPKGKTARTIIGDVERMLQRTGGWLKGDLHVFAGVSHLSAPPALYILLDDLKGPKLEPFPKYRPSAFDHGGFDLEDYRVGVMPLNGKKPKADTSKLQAMLMKRMNTWIRVMKRSKGQMSSFQIEQLAKSIRDTRDELQKVAW